MYCTKGIIDKIRLGTCPVPHQTGSTSRLSALSKRMAIIMKIRFESFNIRCYFIKIFLFLLFLSLLLFHHGHLSHDRLRMLGILISFHDHQVRMGRETESWSGGPWPLSRKSGLLIANATADGHEASTWFMAWHDGIRWAKNPASHESAGGSWSSTGSNISYDSQALDTYLMASGDLLWSCRDGRRPSERPQARLTPFLKKKKFLISNFCGLLGIIKILPQHCHIWHIVWRVVF